MVGIQQLVRRYLQTANETDFFNIAGRSPQVFGRLVVDDENLSLETKLRQRLRKRLCLVIREGKGIDDIELVFFQLESKSGTESSAEHFLWKVVLVISRLRAEDRTALPPQRIPDFADT